MKALGCNAAGSKEYSSICAFIDLVKSSRPWLDGTYAYVGAGTANITMANGYPSAISGGDTARMILSVDRAANKALPTTRYAFTWTGTMTWAMVGTHTNTSLVGNRFEFDWDGASLRIDITAISATIGAFKVFRTDEESLLNSGEIFSPRWISMRAPFGIIRFLGWNEPNYDTAPFGSRAHRDTGDMILESTAVSWNPVAPFSVMAKAAKKLGQIGWYTMPLLVDDAYVLAAAQEIFANTPARDPIYVELCNELWNFSFVTQGEAQAAGVALGYPNEYASTFKFLSHRSQEMWNIFAGVFGQHRIRAVVNGQAAAATTTGAVALDWENCKDYPNICYAIAPYFGSGIDTIDIVGFNTTTGQFTTNAAHGLSTNQRIKLTVASGGGTLPSAFAENTDYRVSVDDSTKFKLDDVNPFVAAITGGSTGSLVTITAYDSGTGQFTTAEAHGFSENSAAVLSAAGGVIPNAFNSTTTYRVHVVDATTFTLDDVNPFVAAITGGTSGTMPIFTGTRVYTGECADWQNYTTDQAMDDIEAQVPTSVGYMTSSYAMCWTARGVRMVAYEGGPHQIGVGAARDSTAISTLLANANASVRMGNILGPYLDDWLSEGGQEFVYFNDSVFPSKFGCWGSLEYQEQTFSAAEKYSALADWSAAHEATWELPMAWTFTNAAITAILNGTLRSIDTYKMALVTSASNIGASSVDWADVTGEVAQANGYLTGGKDIVVALSGTNPVKVDFESPWARWDAAGGSIVARRAVIYEVGGTVLCYSLLSGIDEDVSIPDGEYLLIKPHANGIYSAGT